MIPVAYKEYSKQLRTPIQLIATLKRIEKADNFPYIAALHAFIAMSYIPNNDSTKWHDRMCLFNNHREII